MVNVELLRKIQASILDVNKPFSMGCWGCCIAGHAWMVLTGKRWVTDHFDPSKPITPAETARKAMGISIPLAEHLFSGLYDHRGDYYSRQDAVDTLERIIQEAKPYEAIIRWNTIHLSQQTAPIEPPVEHLESPEEELVCV